MTLIVVTGLLGVLWYVLPHWLKKVQIARLRKRCRDQRLLLLTYDDGPGQRMTSALRAVLREQAASATFFVLGRKLDSGQTEILQLKAEGHELGSHSYQHLHAWKRDPLSIILDVQKGLHSLRSMAECRFFRAPYGKLTLGSLIQLRFQGCNQAWWTIDSTDTWSHPKSVETILQQVRDDGGGVVLMHDMDRSEKPAHEEFVLELTQALLQLAKNEGFRVCRFSEVF